MVMARGKSLVPRYRDHGSFSLQDAGWLNTIHAPTLSLLPRCVNLVMARGKSLVPRPSQRGHCYQAEHSRQHDMVVTSQVRSYVACYSPNVGQSSSEHSFFLHEDMSCESWRMWHRVEAGRVGSFFTHII